MMTLRDLINKLLGRETSSANTARERLQLVLAHDRVDMSSLTTDLLDKMRKEILDVVAKYVEIDFDEVAVSLETEDRMTALVANLPIKRTISGDIKFKKTDRTDKANKSNKDPKSIFDHSLRTLENTLDVCRVRKTHVIYFSSSMVYGNFNKRINLWENNYAETTFCTCLKSRKSSLVA